MTFTMQVNGRTKNFIFHGIETLRSRGQLKDAKYLVLAFYDGIVEEWVVDNDIGLEELKRFYRITMNVLDVEYMILGGDPDVLQDSNLREG